MLCRWRSESEAANFRPILDHADKLYAQALEAPTEEVFRQKTAELYCWLAHACLDLRGSAAKTKIVFRAMYEARGLVCPLWRNGVSADLQAMIRPLDQWLKDYRGLMVN